MNRLLNLVGMTAGGWLGWQLGMTVSMFAAFVLGTVATGIGLYAARRLSGWLLS